MTTYHVVLADDDVSITKGLGDILRGHFPGLFTIHCAANGFELKSLLCSVPAALIPVSAEIRMIVLLGAAAPVGSNVAVYAQLYNSDYPYACQTVALSTIFSIVSLPLIMQLANMIL